MSIVPIKNQQVSGSLTVQSMDDLARLSDMLCKSRFFEDCKDAAQAGVKVLCGLELGIPAFAAMSGIYIVKGKPAIGANVMAAMVKRSGKYNYRVLEHTEQICRIAFYEGREQIGISEFTTADAQRSGTQNMNKFPKNMLFARAMSNGVKFHCPDLFLGAPVYTPDELGAEVNEDGDVISVESVVETEPVYQMDQSTVQRFQDLQKRVEMSINDIASIASKQKPPINIDAMTASEFVRVRNAAYTAWGFNSGVFNAAKHAGNAFQQLLAELEPEAGDLEIWEAWESSIDQRVLVTQQPVEDEEF